MRGTVIRMIAPVLAAAAVVFGCATQASAYTYTIVSGSPLKKVWLHTVSAFCHDRTWQGNWAREGNPLKMSTASICLVDRVEITDMTGRVTSWSGVGVPGQWIVYKYGLNGPYIDMYERDWMH